VVGPEDAVEAADVGVEAADGLVVRSGFGCAALSLQPDIAEPTARATSTPVTARPPRRDRNPLLTPLHPRTTVRRPRTVPET
jgi:hypothetical protein